jgi:hypothetical protein
MEGKGYEWWYLTSMGCIVVMTVYVSILGVDRDDSSLKWCDTKMPLYMYKYQSYEGKCSHDETGWAVPRIEQIADFYGAEGKMGYLIIVEVIVRAIPH